MMIRKEIFIEDPVTNLPESISYLKEKNIACIVATHDAEDALSFADKMIVIQNNQIIAAGTPQDLYQNPVNKYVASLFDDVNELLIHGEKTLIYPHQIKIIEKSDYKATVQNNYFRGTYWLIELSFEGQIIYVNHHFEVELHATVGLQFDKKR